MTCRSAPDRKIDLPADATFWVSDFFSLAPFFSLPTLCNFKLLPSGNCIDVKRHSPRAVTLCLNPNNSALLVAKTESAPARKTIMSLPASDSTAEPPDASAKQSETLDPLSQKSDHSPRKRPLLLVPSSFSRFSLFCVHSSRVQAFHRCSKHLLSW